MTTLWSTVEELAHEHPHLWEKCYTKIYTGVEGSYHSPKIPSYFMLCSAAKASAPEVELYADFNETVELIWASRLADYRVPIFWLEPDITEALRLTTLPGTLDFRTMKLPFEAAIFMLPTGTFQYGPDDVVFVSYARAALKEPIKSINPVAAEMLSGRGDFTVFAGLTDGRLLNWSHPWEKEIDIAHINSTVEGLPDKPLTTGFQTEVSSDDKQFLANVAHLVLNTLQLMISKPQLVSMGSLVKKVQGKKGRVKVFWSPNTIGKDYRIRRVGQHLGGTHASPRGHWVRGFWRDQACGQQFRERREVWIEPFWRGGETE